MLSVLILSIRWPEYAPSCQIVSENFQRSLDSLHSKHWYYQTTLTDKKSILCPWTSIVYRELGTKSSAHLWALACTHVHKRIVHVNQSHDFWKAAHAMGTFGSKVKCNIPAFSRFPKRSQSLLCSASCLLELALNRVIAGVVENCWWVFCQQKVSRVVVVSK